MVTKQQIRKVKIRAVFIPVVIAVILLLIYWPALRWLFNSWLSSDYYSHGFLVPPVSAFLIWTRREYLHIRTPSIIGVFVLIAGILLYGLSFISEIRTLGVLSLIIVLSGIVLLFFGARTTRALAFPLVFLLFMVPFPFIQEPAYHLQEISIYASGWLLEALGLPITISSHEIYLGDAAFTIGLPCSGINTLMALMGLTAIYAYILTGPVTLKVILFILAFPVAIIANILRITSIITVAYYGNIETATGWYHDLSSPLFFALSCLALVFIGRAMKLRLNFELPRRT